MVNLNHLLNHRDSLLKEKWCRSVLNCDWCGYATSPGELVYNCSSHGCGFKLHKRCRDLPSNDTEDLFPQTVLRHLFKHREPLVFIEEQKQYGVNESVWYCDLCKLPIFPGNPLYICSSHGCEFKLHKWCRDLPIVITEHPLHPHHPLTIELAPTNYCYSCHVCNGRCEGLIYICELCSFSLHLDCAAALMKHPSSHRMKHASHLHPLTPLPVPGSFQCIGCGTKHDDGLSYQCTICPRFLVHQDCAVLATTIESPYLHGHPLTLEYAFPEEYSTFSYPCNICGHYMEKKIWLYSCGGCRYFAHVRCAIGKRNTTTQDSGSERVAEEVYHSDVICLPVADESSWTIGDFLKKMELHDNTNGKDNNKMINHFTHVDHPLILLNDQNKEGSTSEPINHKTTITIITTTCGDRRFCSGCLQIISKLTSFYGCVPCNYFLHKDCAFLPTELQNHPFHPQHPLVLLPKGPQSFGLFICKDCLRSCNGFTYGCKNCNYYLDLKCASMPSPITHKTHPPNHLLKRKQYSSNEICHVCGSIYFSNVYKCESCHFAIDKFCAQLPHTIEHRYDKHPLELAYHPLPDHPSEYFCEICEEELNPNKWFYHCAECDQSIHPLCYFDEMENLKYGATINTELHPHPLAFVKPEWNSTCDSCGKSIWANSFSWRRDVGVFECVRCVKFKIHLHCAELPKLEESKNEDNDRVVEESKNEDDNGIDW